MIHLVIRKMLLIAHVKDSFLVVCQKKMWTNEDMVGIYTKAIPACADIARQFQKLLVKPATSVQSVICNKILLTWLISQHT